MKGLFLISLFFGFVFNTPNQPADDDIVKPMLHEVEQTLVHYRAWLTSPATKNVIQGTNHAARATAFIDAYLAQQSQKVTGLDRPVESVGLHEIQKVLLRQIRIHVDLLSTNVPIGIVEYNSDVENAVEEQLKLLEQTLREFERHQRSG